MRIAVLAGGTISFREVGRKLPDRVVVIPHEDQQFANGMLEGTIPILDVQFGNIWMNIDRRIFRKLGLENGDAANVTLRRRRSIVSRCSRASAHRPVPTGPDRRSGP